MSIRRALPGQSTVLFLLVWFALHRPLIVVVAGTFALATYDSIKAQIQKSNGGSGG